MNNVIYYLEYHMSEFTESEQIIAKYFLDTHDVNNMKIVNVANELFVSTATISRFVKKIGYPNYKAFIHEYTYALRLNNADTVVMNHEAKNIWDLHQKFYDRLYSHFATIDLNHISNKIMNAKYVYTFGFGKTQDAMHMIVYRLETITQKMKSINHYEHLLYTMEHVMNYENLIIIFSQGDAYSKDLQKIIKIAEQRFIPVVIVTLDLAIESSMNTLVVPLYPFKDDTTTKYSTTMYTPYLLFIDGLYMALYRKQSILNASYTMY